MEPPRGLSRISTGNLYTPPSTHTHAHIICEYLSTYADMDENLQLLWKSYKNYLRNSTFYWADYGTFVRQPNAMSALQLIYSNICKNIWGEEETNVHFQFQCSKETNGHRGFTSRKHRNN